MELCLYTYDYQAIIPREYIDIYSVLIDKIIGDILVTASFKMAKILYTLMLMWNINVLVKSIILYGIV